MSTAAGSPTTGSTTAVTTGRTTTSDRTIGQLIADASHDLSALLRAEIALAKAEIKKDVVAGAIGAGMFAGAAVFGLFGFGMLLFTAVYAINILVPLWLSFLIVAVLLLLIAGILALVGKSRLSKVKPPERTITTSKASIEAAKGHQPR